MTAARIMDAGNEQKAIVLGEGDKTYLGASITQDYYDISKLLNMRPLEVTMPPSRFRILTQLDPRPNVNKILIGRKN